MQTYSLRAVRARHIASDRTQERYPVIGAVALDLMASIAGPTWAPGHEHAWSAAFEIVAKARGDRDLPAPLAAGSAA